MEKLYIQMEYSVVEWEILIKYIISKLKLGKMLNIDYTKRINTEEILKHPFLDEIN